MQFFITVDLGKGGKGMKTLTVTERGQVTFRKDVLQHLGISPGEKIAWEKHTEEGHAAKTIVERAEAIHADAIVRGTHGRSGLEQMLLGSVAEAVARTAPCPVLTVRPEAFEFKLP